MSHAIFVQEAEKSAQAEVLSMTTPNQEAVKTLKWEEDIQNTEITTEAAVSKARMAGEAYGKIY